MVLARCQFSVPSLGPADRVRACLGVRVCVCVYGYVTRVCLELFILWDAVCWWCKNVLLSLSVCVCVCVCKKAELMRPWTTAHLPDTVCDAPLTTIYLSLILSRYRAHEHLCLSVCLSVVLTLQPKIHWRIDTSVMIMMMMMIKMMWWWCTITKDYASSSRYL